MDLTGLHVADDDGRDGFGDNDDIAAEISVTASEIMVLLFLLLLPPPALINIDVLGGVI